MINETIKELNDNRIFYRKQHLCSEVSIIKTKSTKCSQIVEVSVSILHFLFEIVILNSEKAMSPSFDHL